MSNKPAPRITSVSDFVNIAVSLTVVALIAVGYVGAISDLPVVI